MPSEIRDAEDTFSTTYMMSLFCLLIFWIKRYLHDLYKYLTVYMYALTVLFHQVQRSYFASIVSWISKGRHQPLSSQRRSATRATIDDREAAKSRTAAATASTHSNGPSRMMLAHPVRLEYVPDQTTTTTKSL